MTVYVVIVRFADSDGLAGAVGPYGSLVDAGGHGRPFADRGYRADVEKLFDADELLRILDRLDNQEPTP